MTTPQKITKILIANRGEIACRVIKTARKMGIATVAVYSDADRKALHVRMADEAVHIGPSPANESYLVIDKIIAAAKETGADAVHPGYGFLSENPTFVRACEKAGLNFIGPKAESMEAMGLKDAAKKLMDKAGVPTTPGYHGEDQSPKLLRAKAGMIGYPVLIKAVAGGGGKGMRKVEADADFDAALASCQREARSSFGNSDVLIEKYIQSPRHIEVQVFGDSHGNVVHMFERDCSLQRRHQKVIEEAPAPGMTDKVRAAMTKAAVEAAKAIDYIGAGTVEFIVDGSGKLRTDGFWFMEMNTRLQVEHPVTEMITGLDLVEWQIRVAQGEALPKQDAIKMEGHAIEARLYAEDPANDFLPSIGKITALDISGYYSEKGRMRVDLGIVSGDKISIFYDPMIAKLIGYGPDRTEAIDHLKEGFGFSNIEGLKTNFNFIVKILEHESFRNGILETGFISNHIENLVPLNLSHDPKAFALAASALSFASEQNGIKTPFTVHKEGWKLNQPSRHSWFFDLNDELLEATISNVHHDGWRVHVLNETFYMQRTASDIVIPIETALLHLNEWEHRLTDDYVVLKRGTTTLSMKRYNPNTSGLLSSSGDIIAASMPGKIIAVNTQAGESVKAGDPLIVMEAMKMEMTLEAPRDGVVAEVNFETGALVSDGEVLLTLEDNEDKKAKE